MATLRDANATTNVALPAAGATASTDVLDLGTKGLQIGPVGAQLGLHLTLESCPNLVDAKNVVPVVKHCATPDGSFVAIPGVGTLSILGAGGVGAVGYEIEIYLPPHTLGYIRADIAVDAAGGDNTASHFTMDGRV